MQTCNNKYIRSRLMRFAITQTAAARNFDMMQMQWFATTALDLSRLHRMSAWPRNPRGREESLHRCACARFISSGDPCLIDRSMYAWVRRHRRPRSSTSSGSGQRIDRSSPPGRQYLTCENQSTRVPAPSVRLIGPCQCHDKPDSLPHLHWDPPDRGHLFRSLLFPFPMPSPCLDPQQN